MITQKISSTRLIWIFLAVTGLLLSACSAAARPQQDVLPVQVESSGAYGGAPAAPPAPMEAPASTGAEIQSASVTNQQTIERLVIKTANITLVVSDPPQSMEKIAAMAEAMGGYVVSANLYKETLENGAEVPHGSITVRVPSESLNEALNQVKGESKEDPVTENISSQDVTGEYVDLESRLKNLEAAEAQLTEIMGSATKTEDVLNVYNQLVQVREQIEVIKGQMKYYEQSAALSVISVELIADEAVQPLKIGGWQPVGVAKEAIQALFNALKFLSYLAIWIVILVLPVLLILYGIFFLPLSWLWRTWRRRRAAKKKAALPAPPPQES